MPEIIEIARNALAENGVNPNDFKVEQLDGSNRPFLNIKGPTKQIKQLQTNFNTGLASSNPRAKQPSPLSQILGTERWIPINGGDVWSHIDIFDLSRFVDTELIQKAEKAFAEAEKEYSKQVFAKTMKHALAFVKNAKEALARNGLNPNDFKVQLGNKDLNEQIGLKITGPTVEVHKLEQEDNFNRRWRKVPSEKYLALTSEFPMAGKPSRLSEMLAAGDWTPHNEDPDWAEIKILDETRFPNAREALVENGVNPDDFEVRFHKRADPPFLHILGPTKEVEQLQENFKMRPLYNALAGSWFNAKLEASKLPNNELIGLISDRKTNWFLSKALGRQEQGDSFVESAMAKNFEADLHRKIDIQNQNMLEEQPFFQSLSQEEQIALLNDIQIMEVEDAIKEQSFFKSLSQKKQTELLTQWAKTIELMRQNSIGLLSKQEQTEQAKKWAKQDVVEARTNAREDAAIDIQRTFRDFLANKLLK